MEYLAAKNAEDAKNLGAGPQTPQPFAIFAYFAAEIRGTNDHVETAD